MIPEQYPIPFKSQLHQKLLAAIRQRRRISDREIMKHQARWEEAEKLATAYLPESTADSIRRNARRNQGKQSYRTIEIPYSYALMLTFHTYMSTVFLSRDPVFQFMSRHGESEDAIAGLEALIDYQLMVGGNMIPLYLWLLDYAKYGVGILGTYWEEEVVTTSRFVRKPKTFNGIPIPGTSERVRETLELDGYQGNKFYNVRPQDFIADPRVPMYRLQDGEFCGRYVEISWNDVLRGEASGKYFNVEHLRKTRANKFQQRNQSSVVVNLPGATSDTFIDSLDHGFVSLIEMYVELSPKKWGLGGGSAPEKWVFTVADDSVIIGAQPFGMYHDRFPFFVQEYEFEAYGMSKRGLFDVTKDLNYTLSWLFNSHFYNVRQSLGNQFILDPSRVNVADLERSEAGLMLRLRPEAYGTNVRDAIMQFPVTDVTRGHLQDAEVVMSMMQRVTGITDNLMGMLGQGGRKTATEVRTSSSFGVNRLKTHAEYISSMAWAPLAQVLVQTTQQLYDKEQQYRVGRRFAEKAGEFVNVSPETIEGFYDFVPVDGTLPADRFAQANLWTEITQQIGSSPELAQKFDLARIFEHIAQLTGVNGLDAFRVKVRPDEELQSDPSRIPLPATGAPQNGQSNAATTNAFGTPERPRSPSQISGMGPVG